MELSFKQRLQRFSVGLASAIAPKRTAAWAALKFTTPQRTTRPAWELTTLQRGKCLRLQNGLAAWSWGVGPKVLLVHGWDGRGSQLAAFVDPLVSAGFEAIAIDGPAHGDSPGNRTDLFDFYRAVLSTQRELGALQAVVAHSFGAVSSAVALARGLDTKSIVLIASPCAPQDVFDRFTSMIGLGEKSRDCFQHRVETEAGITTTEGRVDAVPVAKQVPALLIHDEADKEIPFSDVHGIAAAWAAAQLMLTKGLGHRRILKSDEVVRRVVEFICSQRDIASPERQMRA
jgi:pimeloyl-ACP methyl ester carboxylesterase